jgi:hypothetical protein
MAKDAFNKKRALSTSKMDLGLRKKLVKCYVWSIDIYMVLKLGHFVQWIRNTEMWCWRRIQKISWTEHVRNEEVLLKSHGAEEYPALNKRTEG